VVMLDPTIAINEADQVCLQVSANNVIVERTDRAEQWIGKAQAPWTCATFTRCLTYRERVIVPNLRRESICRKCGSTRP
jgi:hypothetical protein